MTQLLPENSGTVDRCWKRIGVWSNEKSCPKLIQVIHCRNCEVFTRAGRNLLEQPLSNEYRDEWTDIMAAAKDGDLPGTISAVIFRIEKEWLALSTQVFSEIIEPSKIHTFPHRKNPVLLGIINVHGEIQLCVSLKDLLGLEVALEKKDAPKSVKHMMVVNSESGPWVFPVNEILGIYRFHPNILQNVPVTVVKAQATYTRGIFTMGKRHISFLDEELLFYSLKRNVQQ